MSLEEALAVSEQGDRERAEKRKELDRLIFRLLDFQDSELGGAVKGYIANMQNRPWPDLTDTTATALNIIAQIQVLEMEC